MHICFVCREYPPSLRGGGIASYIKEMAHGLCRAEHQVTVVCASDDTREESAYKDGDVNIIRLRGGDFIIPLVEKGTLVRRFRPLYKFNVYRKRLAEVVKGMKDVDIIEVAEYGAENYFFSHLNIPVVVRLHAPTFVLDKITNPKQKFSIGNWMRGKLGLKEMEIIKRARYISSCSDALKKIMTKELGVPQERIKVIHNPIQVDKWQHIEHDFRSIKSIKILLPGAITPLKGGEDLIKACQILRSQSIDVMLSLVGKESKFANQLRMNYSHEKWLCVRGLVSREELMDLYKDADIICNPSWFENMPMVCIEAMLLGCIVVASNAGGIPEIITDGVNGFMVTPHSPKLLAEKIRYAASLSPSEKKCISNAARERIIKRFSMNRILNEMLSYYDYVIKDFKQR